MKKSQIYLFLLAAIALFALSACSIAPALADNPVASVIKKSPIASKAVFQIATMRYIDGYADKAASVVEYADYVISIIENPDAAYTVEVATTAIKNEIDWTQLSPQEQVLVLSLIDGVSLYVADQIEGDANLIDADALVTVHQVVGWIREAANLSAVGKPLPAPVASQHINPKWSPGIQNMLNNPQPLSPEIEAHLNR